MKNKGKSIIDQLAAGGRMTRRQFLQSGAAAGMALGLPPLLSACGGSSPQGSETTRHTMFFNLSHIHPGTQDHVLHIAGKRYPLTRTAHAREVLDRAREGNRFLQAVPDESITHHLDAVELPANAVILAYLTCMEDPAQGSWAMTMTHLVLPPTAYGHAYARMRAASGSAAGMSMPHSAKRRYYNLPPASSALDLMEESVLVDMTDHAHALIGMHSDLLSLDPVSAAYIHGAHIASSPATIILASALGQLGPATPQQMPGQPNQNGWATLVPLMNRTLQPPAPFKKGDGRLNLYLPDWHPEVEAGAAKAVSSIQPLVADDPVLGLDVTSVSDGRPLQPQASRGRIWKRHDGKATMDRSAAGLGEELNVIFNSLTTETGLAVNQPTVRAEGGSAAVTLDNVNNWFLRWLGVWVQFTDARSKVIPVASLPAGTLEGWGGRGPLDLPNALFAGMMPPVNVLAGVPIDPGTFAPVLRMPPDAQSMQVFYGGLGVVNSPVDGIDDTAVRDALARPGVIVTVLVNYVLTTMFMVAGASPLSETLKKIIDILGQGLIVYLVDFFSEAIINKENADEVIKSLITDLSVMLVNSGANAAITGLVEAVLPMLAQAQIIDSVPVAGQVARVMAAVIGGVQIGETTAEVLMSPPVYAFNLTLTHRIVVTVRPDASGAFPAPSTSDAVLYYRMSYLFDSGPCHELPAVDFPRLAGSPPVLTVELDGLPLGGKVQISIGLYIRSSNSSPGAGQRCVAKGDTGLIANQQDMTPEITLSAVSAAIKPGSTYVHASRTVLGPDGAPVWMRDSNAPPYLPPPGDQQPGLGALRNITLSQRTASRDGYVGYAWQAYGNSNAGCGTAAAQADYLASMGVEANRQLLHASTQCGMQSGAQIGYNLISNDSLNIWLDPNQLYLRQVQLGSATPFAGNDRAYGRLNLTSSAMLLHPSGYIVSINTENHIMETLRLPGTPVDDATAARLYTARPHSGQGSRPGLMNKPVAAVITPAGAILVLEAGDTNNRIQAFDLGGNSIPYFKGQQNPYFLQLDATAGAIYLDIAAEFGDYIYVLSRDEAGNHRLDIYWRGQQDRNPVCTTFNINAAALAVDFWRNVFTLNYQAMTLPGGALPALPEPSISVWKPPLD